MGDLRRQRDLLSKRLASGLAGLALLALASTARAQVSAGYSEYYVPGDEDNMGRVLCTNGATACPAPYHTHAVISVTGWSDNTTVYYDQWEDTYDFDPTAPATADDSFTINTGDRLVFESANMGVPRWNTYPTAPTRPPTSTCDFTATLYRAGGTSTVLRTGTAATTCYDGGDRLYIAGGLVTVTRVGWIEERGVGLQGTAWEIYPVKPQLTTYIVPFGETVSTGNWYGFQRVATLIEATVDNTIVQIDVDGGGFDILNVNRDATWNNPGDSNTITLSRGQTFLLDRISACVNHGADCVNNPGALPTGVIIQGSETLQVKYITGRTDVNNNTRGFSAFPRGFWTKSYYAPLEQPGNDLNGQASTTDYYLYNPDLTRTITVDWQGLATSGSLNIAPNTTVSFRATEGAPPANSGLFFSSADVFWGVGSNDTSRPTGGTQGYAHEWGFSLLPSTMLYTEHYLGWAPDGLPLAAGQTMMGVYITPAQDNTLLFVDYSADGTADATYTLNRLASQFIADPDGDLSGARFWATGPFSMAYGQNSENSDNSTPALDLGYVAIPGTDFISLVLGVDKSASPQIVPATPAGSRTTFTVRVSSQRYTVSGVNVVDTLPFGWRYVSGSTTITKPDKTQVTGVLANPDTITGPAPDGPYVLTWLSARIGGDMVENEEIEITFQAETTRTFSVGNTSENRVRATGTRTVGGITQTFSATDFAFVTFGTAYNAVAIDKTSNAAVPLYPGDTFTYTTVVSNPASSTTTLTGVSILDPIPTGVSYVAGSGTVTCDRGTTANLRDEFGSQAYNLTNGSVNWSANPWVETDLLGGGATGGFVFINTGGTSRLQFRYQQQNAADLFSSVSYARQDGNINWSTNWLEAGDDGTAAGGVITANGARLNFGPGTVGRSITRTAPIPAGADTATISFALSDNGIDNSEGLIAEYSFDGTTWPEIQRITNATLTPANPLPAISIPTGATSISLRFTSFDTGNGTFEAGDNAGVDTVNIAFIGARIQRTANLTGAGNPSLTFTFAPANLDAGQDTVVLEASQFAGGPWTTLATFNAGTPDNAQPYDLTSFISGTTTIRFRVTGGFETLGETFSVDNVDITYYVPDTLAATAPPEFLSSGSGCVIRPGGIPVTLSFNVTVDNPLPTGLTEITNTASTTSTQIPFAVYDSVTDVVVNPDTATASVAGHIWLDGNRNGAQDFGEGNLANIEVTLKDQFGTPLASRVTDATGNYLFTDVLPANGYYVEVTGSTVPSGLVQMVPYTTTPGDLTTNRRVPFNLAAGQARTDENFAYGPASGTATFGDLVWHDPNSNGARDPGEIGFGGVTMQLYQDNGDSLFDPMTDTLLPAYTRTSAPDGSYLMTGVPAGDTYWVVAASIPSGYVPTTASSFLFQSVTGGTAYLTADVGFASGGPTPTPTYSLTDRVWYDTDSGQDFDTGIEFGISGVTIELLDSSLNVIGTTTTDANGIFTFAGLPGSGADYTTRISDTAGVLSDYFGTTDYAKARERAESNLTADRNRATTPAPNGAPSYGFLAARSLGDTVCVDSDNNGACGVGELGIPGVTIELLDSSLNVIGTTTTDANGHYVFTGLTIGATYIVSVESPPTGYTYSGTGARADSDPGTPGQQQPWTIPAGGAGIVDADFPYRPSAARSLDGYVWNNTDGDAVLDAGEPRLSGVTVDILSGGVLIRTVTTDANGYYSATDLPSGTYVVRVTDTSGVLTSFTANYEVTEGAGAPSYNYEEAVDLTSGNATAINFGYIRPQTTYAVIAYLKAFLVQGSVFVEWQTAVELGTVGFHLWRLDPDTGKPVRVTETLVPALQGHPHGGTYRVPDATAPHEGTLRYTLVEVERGHKRRAIGPYAVAIGASADEAVADDEPEVAAEDRSVGRFRRRPSRLSPARRDQIHSMQAERRNAARHRAQRRGLTLKVATRDVGLHYLSAAQMAEVLGLKPQAVVSLIRSQRLALMNRGRQIPSLPDSLGAGVYFYAEPVNSAYTNDNVYWVTTARGETMAATPSAREGVPAASFTETLHQAVDQYPARALFTDPSADMWVWDFVLAGYEGWDSKVFSVRAPGATGNGPAALVVRLGGASDTHHVVVRLNGRPVGEATWGQGLHTLELPIDGADLVDGDNTVEVQALLDPGVGFSFAFIDSFDLRYERRYQAQGDTLTFTGQPGQALSVTGFSTPEVLLFDVSYPARPALVRGYTIVPVAGSLAVQFNVPDSAGQRRYLAHSAVRPLAPVEVEAWTSSGLRDRWTRADYVLIAPDSLRDAAQELADYRSGQGMTTLVVDLDAIYNEFSAGFAEPLAIQTFLRYATEHWALAPRYVTLVGRGTYDYKDVLGMGDNLIPPLMAGSPDGLFVTDLLFADLVGDDGIPEIALGRLPVITSESLRGYIAKVKAHEAAEPGPWQRRVVLAADRPDGAGNFSADSEQLAALLPGDSQIDRIYIGEMGPAAARAALFPTLQSGVALLNFIGHGGYDRLANDGLLTADDIPALESAGPIPVFLGMTCVVGDASVPGYASLGEMMLLKPDGGALAVWAPTWLSANQYAVRLNSAFFRAAFVDGEKTVGDAMRRALGALTVPGSKYMRYTYNLLGEPVARLPQPVQP